MNLKTQQNPELLAPAGSLEAFFAAMEKGADAVYCGLKDFSARAKAKNFTAYELERMLRYAHGLGRSVYVTLNTLVKENELPHLVDTLATLAAMQVDGVILQDMGVFRLIRDHFPQIPLHASTQMTVHNAAGVRQLEELGFTRVVLARELHLDDIAAIRRETSVELECFIHGALCFSFSGQCYFSSLLGGHSGNRGRCAQPCRRLYRYRGKEGYYFSTNDFSTIDLLPQMVAAGVKSFKIEGRMKSAEYVATVVEAYRAVLDAPERQQADAVARGRELLKESLGRTPTKGFLASATPADIASPHLKGATGRFLGDIRQAKGGQIHFTTKAPFRVGDRLRVQPRDDMPGKGFTVKEILRGKEKIMAAQAGAQVTVSTPFAAAVGDAVFKVSSTFAFTMSDAACRRKLEQAEPEKIPCRLTLSLSDGILRVVGEAQGIGVTEEYPMGELEASRTENMNGVLAAQFSRTGETPFTLESLASPDFPRVLIPASRLKEIRRSFYQSLEERLQAGHRDRAEQGRRSALAAIGTASAGRPSGREEVVAKLDSIRDWTLLNHDGIDSVTFPLTRGNMNALPGFIRKFEGKRDRIVWHLPFIVLPQDFPRLQGWVRELLEAGFRRFELSNLGHLPLFRGAGAELSADYRLFSLNSQAILAWHELGLSAVTLYLEDDEENMGSLLRAELPVKRRVLAFSGVPVITSRIPIRAVKSDAPVVSDRGDEYLVHERDGLTVVTAATHFSVTEHRDRLKGMGCNSFILDLSHQQAERRRQVLEAFTQRRRLQDTTTFNYTTGLA